MDLDEIRRKRQRKFANYGSSGDHDDHAEPSDNEQPASSTSSKPYPWQQNQSPVDTPQISDDERMAIDLQKQLDAEDEMPFHDASSPTVKASKLPMGYGENALQQAQNMEPPKNDQEEVALAAGHIDSTKPVDFVPLPLGTVNKLQSVGFPMPLQPFPTPGFNTLDAKPLGMPPKKKVKRTPKEPIIAEVVDHSPEAKGVRALAGLIPTTCAGCGAQLVELSTRDRILRVFDLIVPNTSNFVAAPGLPHASCADRTCYGCGNNVYTPSTTETVETHLLRANQHYTVVYHCSKGRLVMIYSVLCGFDNKSKHNKKTKKPDNPMTSKAAAPPGVFGGGVPRPRGVGYASGSEEQEEFLAAFPANNGESSDHDEADAADAVLNHDTFGRPIQMPIIAPALTIPELADDDDKLTAFVMQAVAALLGDTQFDEDFGSKCLRVMLEHSSLLDRIASLLHVSPETVRCKAALYEKLVVLVRTLSSHKATRYLLSKRRVTRQAGHNLFKVALGEPTMMRNEPEETTCSLIASMYKLANACEKEMQLAMSFQGADHNSPLPSSIVDMVKIVKDRCASDDVDPNADAVGNTQQLQSKYAWQRDIQVQEVEGSILTRNYYFAKEMEVSAKSGVAKNRMKRIIKEIDLLKGLNNLPENIFVRYADSRPDCMKVLIIGPESTPYENGMFEFDLICPSEFPQSPPMMQFKTTERGRVHFNPNLYADGKVCLSILNTWAQPQWIPTESTILQILISIQAMIFTEQPYCNEPGWANMADTEQCKQYNRETYPKTVDAAMLTWLEHRHGFSLWNDIIEKHFKENEAHILRTMDVWIADKPPAQPSKAKASSPLPWIGLDSVGQMLGGGSAGAFPLGTASDGVKKSALSGTGWAGKTLGGGALNEKEITPSHLVSKLRGAHKALVENAGSSGMAMGTFIPGDEFSDPDL